MSNVNVVDFPTNPEVVWHCGCGCVSFIIHQDDSLECAECGQIQHEMEMKEIMVRFKRKKNRGKDD